MVDSLKVIGFLALEGVGKIGENQCSENCCYRPALAGRVHVKLLVSAEHKSFSPCTATPWQFLQRS
jgi:hypothetical protein